MNIPKLLGYQTFVVISGNMEPDYPIGSIEYVQEVTPESIETGDIITFYIGDTGVVVTHQVYKIDNKNKMFYAQGINNMDNT